MKAAVLALLLAGQAQAAVIGIVQFDSGALLRLHDKPGVCVGGALLVEFVVPGMPTVPGCWIIRGQLLGLAFLDGESGTLPVVAVRKPETV